MSTAFLISMAEVLQQKYAASRRAGFDSFWISILCQIRRCWRWKVASGGQAEQTKGHPVPQGLLRGGREHLTDAPDLVALQGSQGEKLKPMAQAVAISD